MFYDRSQRFPGPSEHSRPRVFCPLCPPPPPPLSPALRYCSCMLASPQTLPTKACESCHPESTIYFCLYYKDIYKVKISNLIYTIIHIIFTYKSYKQRNYSSETQQLSPVSGCHFQYIKSKYNIKLVDDSRRVSDYSNMQPDLGQKLNKITNPTLTDRCFYIFLAIVFQF